VKTKLGLILLTGILAVLACLYTYKAEDTRTCTRLTSLFARVDFQTRNGAVTVSAQSDTLARVQINRYAYGRNKEDAQQRLARITIEDTVYGNVWSLKVNFPISSVPQGAILNASLPAATALNLTTANGKVTVSGMTGGISVTTSNGDVILTGTAGDAELNTSNGKALIQVHAGGISIQTSNGEIDCDLSLLPATRGATLTTSNGRVILRLPPDVSATINATTTNGTVVITGYQVQYEENTQHRIRAKIGSGASPVTITTSNADITIQNRVH
jgi:DUF4097 and DUF4098 domain-containing protein YvlB